MVHIERKSQVPHAIDMLLCHQSNLWPQLHSMGHMFWQKSCFMCWNIRKCSSHNLWICLPPKWLTYPSKRSTSCIKNTLKADPQSSNMFALNTVTVWRTICLEPHQNTRKHFFAVRLAMLTPKWSTCPGRKSTSCFDNVLRHYRCNLQLLLHQVGRIFW